MHTPTLLSATLFAGLALTSGPLSPEKAVQDIQQATLENLVNGLDEVAQNNGGNRAFGLPGFDASVDYIYKHLGNNSKLDISVQPFHHLFSITKSISLTGPGQEDIPVISLQYNHPTPNKDGVTASLFHLPLDEEQGTGCTEDQWNDTNFKNGIPLVKRSNKCHFTTILKLAKENSAPAVLIYNNVPGVTGGSASLGAENQGSLAPVGVITFEQGNSWAEKLETGESVEVNLQIDVLTEERETRQVFVETSEGNPENVIMLGAHLDSVQEGPGINDNGSGVVALLAIANSFSKYNGIRNKVRFAFWGAEESGMIGSLHYTSTLPPEEVERIRFYFNYDMIASPEPAYTVYADTEAHKVGAQHLRDLLVEQGRPAETVPFESPSDYVGFLDLGIPCSAIFTGAGAPYDSCYHSKCDGIKNINLDALTINTKAAAYAAAKLSMATDLPPRNQTSFKRDRLTACMH